MNNVSPLSLLCDFMNDSVPLLLLLHSIMNYLAFNIPIYDVICNFNSVKYLVEIFYALSFQHCQSPDLQPSYWCSSPRMALVNEKEEEEDAEKALKGEFIEEEPAGLVSGIKIKHLAKVSSRRLTCLCTVNRWRVSRNVTV